MNLTAWLPLNDLCGIVPDVPSTKVGLRKWVDRLGIRTRIGRGNGGRRIEALAADLPEDVRAALERRGAGLPVQLQLEGLKGAFRQRKAPAKERAGRKAAMVIELERLVAEGAGQGEAQAQVAAAHGVSPRTLRRLAAKSRGVERGPDLAPALADSYKPRERPEPPWARRFLKLYRVPTKRSIADVVEQMRQELGAAAPSESQARRFVGGLPKLERERGRRGPGAMKAIRSYRTRTVDNLLPGDVYISDGHTFDAEIEHPCGGLPPRGYLRARRQDPALDRREPGAGRERPGRRGRAPQRGRAQRGSGGLVFRPR